MNKVPPFASQRSVWHFHPLEFMEIFRSAEFPKTLVNGELTPIEFINFYNEDRIDDTDYEEAAKELGCEVAAIKAVAKQKLVLTAPILSLKKTMIMFLRYYLKDITFINIQMGNMIISKIYQTLLRVDMAQHQYSIQN